MMQRDDIVKATSVFACTVKYVVYTNIYPLTCYMDTCISHSIRASGRIVWCATKELSRWDFSFSPVKEARILCK